MATDDFFIYRMGAVVPQNVTRVRIHPSVEHIPKSAFELRADLVEVKLHDGLRTIGDKAFFQCTSLHRIMIPSSVTDIGNDAFHGCRSLTEVDLTEGLQTIKHGAFAECTSLPRVKIPSSVTDIGDYAFCRCTSLKEVNLKEGLRSIKWGTFRNCTSLHRINIPSSVTDIGIYAFESCTSLREVQLHDGLRTIGNDSFRNCTSLQQVKVPSSVITIYYRAFLNCTSLKEVNLEVGLQTIGEYAFKNCSSLLHIRIPSSVTTIKYGAFLNCMSLKEVNLEEGLQTIEQCAFQHCASLLRINIPSTVNSLLMYTFMHCTLLRNVAFAPSSFWTQAFWTQDVFNWYFPSLKNMGFSLEMIIGRFDELPLHKKCYYYRSQLVEQTMDSTTPKWFNEEVGRLPAHGLQQDCFGMTPLHVLLCSSAGYDVRVCQSMIEKYPGAMLIKDRWGEVPLAYALFGEAPFEVIHLFLETHMQRWQAMPFDFGDVILRLAMKRGTSADYVRDVIRAQRTHHHALEIDWQRIVDDLIRARHDIPIRVFSVLVEASVSKRSICMSVGHRIEVDARLHEIEIDIKENEDASDYDDDDGDEEEDGENVQYYEEIRDMVTGYARLYHRQLKESITILELALWKTMIRSKVDDQESRNERRTSGGRCLEVVIKHVLAFL